jgi:hypothetical protein
MAYPDIPASGSREAPEVPLLAVFALLIVIAVVAIGLMIAVPTALTMIVALGTVMGFAAAVSYLLARMIGD